MSTPFVAHVEWSTPDPAVLEKFLTELFGWQFQPFMPTYLMYIPADGKTSVGIRQADQAQPGGTPNVSVLVPDMDATLLKAKDLGAKIVVEKTSMGNGAFAFVAAPDGNIIGLQQL